MSLQLEATTAHRCSIWLCRDHAILVIHSTFSSRLTSEHVFHEHSALHHSHLIDFVAILSIILTSRSSQPRLWSLSWKITEVLIVDVVNVVWDDVKGCRGVPFWSVKCVAGLDLGEAWGVGGGRLKKEVVMVTWWRW